MNIRVRKQNIILTWLYWYLIDVPVFLLKAWRNILLFNLRFFSISFLLRTYFSYWHRYRWYYDERFSLIRFFEVAVSNMVSRFLGAFMRTFVILFGIITEIIIFFIGAVVILLWFAIPFITIAAFILSTKLIL